MCNSLLVCGLYYYVWAKVLPKWKGYVLRQELVDLGGGAETHIIKMVPVSQVADWDIDHDAVGRLRNRAGNVLPVGDEKVGHSSSDVDLKNVAIQNTDAV
jgi:hypothetical protein